MWTSACAARWEGTHCNGASIWHAAVFSVGCRSRCFHLFRGKLQVSSLSSSAAEYGGYQLALEFAHNGSDTVRPTQDGDGGSPAAINTLGGVVVEGGSSSAAINTMEHTRHGCVVFRDDGGLCCKGSRLWDRDTSTRFWLCCTTPEGQPFRAMVRYVGNRVSPAV